jgi:catecholate siderophore receptor
MGIMSQTRIKAKKKKLKTGGKPNNWSPKYWMAVGTLAAYAGGGSELVLRAHAQDRTSPASQGSSGQTSSGQTGDLPVRHFEIAAGPLSTVLASFQQTSGITVSITSDSIRDISSPGVVGLYSSRSALQTLLEGTGITYRFAGPGAVILQVEGPSVTVDVKDTGLQNLLPKYVAPLVDTPQSIDIVPEQIIQDQGATTLRDTLRNVAGISLAAGEGGAQGDSLTIRGFTARNDIFLDGMRDFGSYYRDPFVMQQVEVLQGPSSVTFGRGSTGGIVEQDTKTPELKSMFAGSLDLGTDQTRRVIFDMERRLPSLGEGTAFRLNLMGHDSKIAGRDIGESRRVGAAPSLAFGLGTPTRLTLSYFHQSADDTPDYGLPWLFNRPAPVDRSNYYGFRHGNFLKTHVGMGTVILEHTVNDAITLRNQVRYAHYYRDVRITEAQVGTTFDGAVVTPTTPLDQIQINRNEITVNSLETFLQDQADVTMRFRTGFMHHNLVAGVEGGRETSSPYRPRYDINTVPKTGLLDPDTTQAFAGTILASTTTDLKVTAISVGAYGVDTVNLAPKWDLTGGVRVDRFDASLVQPIPANSPNLERVDVMPSWRTALVFKPMPEGSIYFAYGTSFNPSAETLSLSASTQPLPPEENKSMEVGSKWELFSRKLSLRTSVFRTTKENARETDPTNSLLTVLAGTQRVNGFQVQTSGYLTNRWEMLASYAYLQGKEVASRFFPLAVGYPLANVPRNTFSLWNSYDLPWHLGVGGGADFVDSRTASSTVPLDPTTGLLKHAPGYWVFNAMAKCALDERVDLRVNVYNLADKYYYDQIHPAHVVPGAARSATLGINYKF